MWYRTANKNYYFFIDQICPKRVEKILFIVKMFQLSWNSKIFQLPGNSVAKTKNIVLEVSHAYH